MFKNIIIIFILYFLIVIYANAAQIEVDLIENYYLKSDGKLLNIYMYQDMEDDKALFSLFLNAGNSGFSARTTNVQNYNNISSEKKNNIQDILHLGYNYKGNKELKWYLLSQYMLYKEMGNDIDIVDDSGLSIIYKFADEYAEYLGDEFYKLNVEFDKTFKGEEIIYDNDKEFMYELIYSLFQDTIVNEFAKKHFTIEEKRFYTELIKEEIKTFENRINKEEWLSDSSKLSALDKMSKMKYTVGVPDNLVYTENSYTISNNNSYLSNIININKVIYSEYNKQYRNGNILYHLIDPLVQNAYYEANTNSINILLGMIYSYKVTLNLDVSNLDNHFYELLGTAGVTIGHELTHALDSNGSKYDSNGNYVNWWSDKDKENFDKLNIDVVKYFNNYNQFGSQTLGENIADLGGMALVMDVAKKRNTSSSNYKKIFEYYALDWCSQKTPVMRANLLYGDEHSPDKNRVNAILSSVDEFYSVYFIKESDDMFIPEKDRVSVW